MRLRRSTVRSSRRKAQRPARQIAAGLLTVGLILAFIGIAENAYNGVPLVKYRTVYVSVPNVGHLRQHDPVNIAGARVGQVVRTTTKKNVARVELQLQGVGPLPADTQAVIRAQGLLGSRYVELNPGKSHKMLPNRATIAEHNPTQSYTNGVAETLDLFDPKTRRSLGQMVSGLGGGVEGRGTQLNETLRVGGPSGHDLDSAVYAILDRRGAAARFLPNSEAGFGALDAPGRTLTDTFDPLGRTANAFVTERSATEQSIAKVPGVETKLGEAFSASRGQRLWRSVGNLSSAMAPVLPKVSPALRDTSTLLVKGRGPLRRAKPVVDAVPKAGPATLDILAKLRPDLQPLRQAFTKLGGPVSTLARHGCDIQSAVTGLPGLVSYGTVPGGNWGPNVGFPIVVASNASNANPYADSGFRFPDNTGYNQPCKFTPGTDVSVDQLIKTPEFGGMGQ